MAVLGDIDLRTVIENDEGLVISNLRDKSITAAGYDLTIGFICDADDGTLPELVSEINSSVRRYRLLSGHRYLIISREYVSFPTQYMATMHSRISYVLKGIMFTSTTIDPNFEGFLLASIINCSRGEVFIKEHNQFATMVIHQVLTPTETGLQENEDGTPRDGQGTLNMPFSNIDENAAVLAKIYVTEEFQKIKADHRAAQLRVAKKIQEKQDVEIHTQALSEMEALNKQHLSDLQMQINSMQEELDTSRQVILEGRKKRRNQILMQYLVIVVLLFMLLYSYWGLTLKTVLTSVIISCICNIWTIPSFIVDTKAIVGMIKNQRRKQ